MANSNSNTTAAIEETAFPRLSISSSIGKIWQGFRKENLAFIVTCLYLIFEYNRPHMVYPALDIIPWGKFLLLLAILLAFNDQKSTAPPAAAVRPMISFSFIVLLSTIFAYSSSMAIEEWTMFFGWFFAVLLITSVVSTRKRLFLFLVVFFLCNLKMAQHGFKSWASRGFSFAGWGVGGSPGWFQNSGEFSLEMVVFLPLVLIYLVTFRRQWSWGIKIAFCLFAIMALGSIIASSSRGGVLGLIMVGIWFVIYSRHRFLTILILTFFGFIILLTIPPEFKARFETIGVDRTSLSRLRYWEFGLEAIKDNPFTGVGYRNWTIWISIEDPELQRSDERIEVIHNTYLEAATELGLLGAAVYLAILLQIFITNHRSIKIAHAINDRFLSATAIGLNGSLLGYLLPSYFMSVLYYPFVWMNLALSVCVSSILAVRSRGAESQN